MSLGMTLVDVADDAQVGDTEARGFTETATDRYDHVGLPGRS